MLSYNHSKQLLFSLRPGFGVGSVSVLEDGQPRALPGSAGQSGPGCKGAQDLECRARGCECGSPPPAQLLLAADCGFASTEHAANYNQTMSNHSPAGGLALVRGLAGFSLELPCPLKANGALNSSSLSSNPGPPSSAQCSLSSRRACSRFSAAGGCGRQNSVLAFREQPVLPSHKFLEWNQKAEAPLSQQRGQRFWTALCPWLPLSEVLSGAL